MDQFHLFINFPQAVELLTDTADSKIFSNILNEIAVLIDRADCEKGVQLYYQEANKLRFFEDLASIESEMGQFGVLDNETALNQLLYEADAINWEEKSHFDANATYFLWNSDHFSMTEITVEQDFLKELAERMLVIQAKKTNEKLLLINVKSGFVWERASIPVLKDSRNMLYPQLVCLPYCNDFQGLEAWLQQNRKQRNYNFSDNRHVEGHPQYIKGKSPLLDGQAGKSNAAEHLKTAIGDERYVKYLVNFDSNKKCYIRFEFENDNPQNQYHGYHLVIPKTHEIDSKAIKEIPARVRTLLDYRKSKEK
jgi:hypothetical protein